MITGETSAMRVAIGSLTVRHVVAVITAFGSLDPAFASAATAPETPGTQEPSAPGVPSSSMPVPQAPAEAEAERAEGANRVIKDHAFIFPSYVESSIVASYVGLRIRLGDTSVNGLPTEVGSRDLNGVTLKEGLEVGVKITDWLALFATGGFRSLIGTNLGSQVFQGSTYDFGGYGGAIFRLLDVESSGTRLALRASAGYTRGQFVTLYPLFDHPIMSIVDVFQGNLESSIATPFSTFEYSGGLAFAQSISRLFGVQASAAFGGSTVNLRPFNSVRDMRESSTIAGFTFALGVAPSIDFNAFKVPIAVMPEYVIVRAASSDQGRGAGDFDTHHQIAVGAYYSGRTNLQLGLNWMTVLGIRPLATAQGSSQTPSQQQGEFVLRYIW